MPFVKPEWKSISLNTDTAISLENYMAFSDSEIEYEGETITKLDYLKRYLFDGKYDSSIEVVNHGGVSGDYQQGYVFGLYLDRNNNDRASFFIADYPTGSGMHPIKDLATHAYMSIPDCITTYPYSGQYWKLDSLMQAFHLSNSVGQCTMYVRSFNTFCIMYISGYASIYNGNTSRTAFLYDFTNKEYVLFDDQLANIQFSKPDHYVYSKPLTNDGANGRPYNQIIRTSSNSEIRYTKLKFIDGTESRRVYMLTQLPARSEGSILTMESKKFYILPYYSDSYCALAIECTADVTE